MFNLLPNLFKDEIKAEYNLRKWIVLLSLVLFLQISFLALTISIWTIFLDKETEASNQVKKENEVMLSQSTNDILKVINATNQKITIIDKTMFSPEILPIYDTIISQKTTGISLREFNYNSSATESTLSLKGLADTRETLVSFVKKLQDLKVFSNVDLPVSNLAKQKDIEFNIDIKINNKL